MARNEVCNEKNNPLGVIPPGSTIPSNPTVKIQKLAGAFNTPTVCKTGNGFFSYTKVLWVVLLDNFPMGRISYAQLFFLNLTHEYFAS